MTAEEHNRTLGILHMVYGGLSVLLLVLVALFMMFMLGVISGVPNAEPFPTGFLAAVMVFVLAMNALFIIPSFVAGYALLNKKPWARTAGIIAAVVDAMSVPFGTALCIYSLWFLFSENGKRIYEGDGVGVAGPRGALYETPANTFDWQGQPHARGREETYAPPQTPPDWRGHQ